MPKKGYKPTEEHKRKISESHKGKHHSAETKRKMSENNGMLNKHHTEETKKKIREKRKLQITTLKTREKMSETHKRIRQNHWNWRGGITSFTKIIRRNFKYRLWISDVFTKDNFICQNCRIRGGDLEVHHIKKFSDIVKEYNIKTLEQALNCRELWDINNGQTLCLMCHNQTKKYEIS